MSLISAATSIRTVRRRMTQWPPMSRCNVRNETSDRRVGSKSISELARIGQGDAGVMLGHMTNNRLQHIVNKTREVIHVVEDLQETRIEKELNSILFYKTTNRMSVLICLGIRNQRMNAIISFKMSMASMFSATIIFSMEMAQKSVQHSSSWSRILSCIVVCSPGY